MDLKVVKYLILTLGGGSSRIAAKKANCEYVGFEIDTKYCQLVLPFIIQEINENVEMEKKRSICV